MMAEDVNAAVRGAVTPGATDIWLAGRPVGEIGLAHATAAAIGVALTVLTGDDCACTEMTEWDASVRTGAVKHARDRFAASLTNQPPYC
ncbi:M55 family metallopeptidase [Streptomyces sp. NPDC101776]|uniref:M55 family metallopeptidase n=1 Tax=Streptomyces sp. NPDC101776 TaxID=3366146 RepID=UPI00381F0C39